MRILLLEDEPAIALGVRDNLELEGYLVDHFENGKLGLDACMDDPPDLLILDLGLPGLDGMSILQRVHQVLPHLPVLILTARSSETDILKGFKKGAHDYVTKPFSPRVLLARVEALLQRFRPKPTTLVFAGKQVNLDAMTGPNLTTREFMVLKQMALAGGNPVSRLELLEEVWGMESAATDRVVDTLILELRKKLEPEPAKPVFILTQRGVGYKLSQKVFP